MASWANVIRERLDAEDGRVLTRSCDEFLYCIKKGDSVTAPRLPEGDKPIGVGLLAYRRTSNWAALATDDGRRPR